MVSSENSFCRRWRRRLATRWCTTTCRTWRRWCTQTWVAAVDTGCGVRSEIESRATLAAVSRQNVHLQAIHGEEFLRRLGLQSLAIVDIVSVRSLKFWHFEKHLHTIALLFLISMYLRRYTSIIVSHGTDRLNTSALSSLPAAIILFYICRQLIL